MVTPELRKFVADSLAAHRSITSIREELTAIGWSTRDINQVCKETSLTLINVPTTPSASLRKAPHFLFYTLLLGIILVLIGTVYYLWENQIDLTQMNDHKVREFYTELAQAQISYTDTGEMIFPDEQKFITQKAMYVEEKTSFIEANLRTMELTLYDHGVATATVPILTKGKERSWWETPTGNYTILGKSITAFSSIGHVWMPYSMQFYGNYFIHGWPYYDDGTPVASTYSGGCIRLATDDAEIVFNFAKVGTPILVLEDDTEETPHTLVSKPTNGNLPPLHTQSFLIADLATGKTILERDSDEILSITSVTKLMTAVVAHEILYLGRSMTVAPHMLARVSEAFTPASGDEYTGLDLLYPLLMQSSNETAEILAGPVGGKTFIQNMNTKAASLQMHDTTFVDVTGASSENISTAKDLAKLFQYVYYKRSFLFDITKGVTFTNVGYIPLGDTVNIGELKNENSFIEDPGLAGVVHGDTKEAEQTLVTVWSVGTPEKNAPIALILLNSTHPEEDTKALHTWVTQNFVVE